MTNILTRNNTIFRCLTEYIVRVNRIIKACLSQNNIVGNKHDFVIAGLRYLCSFFCEIAYIVVITIGSFHRKTFTKELASSYSGIPLR